MHYTLQTLIVKKLSFHFFNKDLTREKIYIMQNTIEMKKLKEKQSNKIKERKELELVK